jgi:hypothetical protein
MEVADGNGERIEVNGRGDEGEWGHALPPAVATPSGPL